MMNRSDFIAAFAEKSNVLGQEDIEKQCVVSVLSERAIIKVSGDDAEAYLQNQFTNDISLLVDNSSQLSGWCTPKGRLIATFRIAKQAECFYILLAADLLDKVQKRMQMFVMRSKVTLEDVTEKMAHIGVLDEVGLIKQHPVPDDALCLALPGERVRYDCIAPVDSLKPWLDGLPNVTFIDESAWQYFDIEAGQPHVSEASSEAWIPQMLNMQVIDGVNFKKGCFPGQEVVARLKYLGKNKRRVYRLALSSDTLPAIASVLCDDEGNDVGKVLMAAYNPEQGVEVLAVLKIAQAEETLVLADDFNTQAILLTLPYDALLEDNES